MFLYYLIVALILALVGPFLLLAPRRRAGIGQKLGFIPAQIRTRLSTATVPPVWFHTVSVGEFNAAYPLLKSILKEYPQQPLVVSTSTATGQKLARERLGSRVILIYFPFDLPATVNSWLDAIKPAAVMIVETEIWPGFIWQCKRRGIPVLVLNGRMSLKSFKSYFAWRAFFGPVIRRFHSVVAQSQAEAGRYQSIAGPQLKTVYFGNLKFDGLQPILPGEADKLRVHLGLAPEDDVFIAGSTHEGEELAVLNAWRQCKAANGSHRKLRLIIAPRHPERWLRVAQMITATGCTVRRYSENETFTGDDDVYLLDTIGQLFCYYSLATMAFVGGTLVPVGGHNVVEPFAYGAAVVCGPHLFKTREVAESLRQCGALTVVNDEQGLQLAVEDLLRHPSKRVEQGNLGRQWLSESQGAVAKTLDYIRPWLKAPSPADPDKAEGALKV